MTAASFLATRWRDFCRRRAGNRDRADNHGRRVIAAYTANDRHYHNAAHIADVIRNLDMAKTEMPDAFTADADLYDALFLAAFYHDAVYDPQRADNESRSRDDMIAACTDCDIDAALARAAAPLIDITAHHAAARTIGEKIISDCDLASLAVAPAQFRANSNNIRREYAHVGTIAFFYGRRKALAQFADHAHIYHTPPFRARYDAQARKNLAAALAPPYRALAGYILRGGRF